MWAATISRLTNLTRPNLKRLAHLAQRPEALVIQVLRRYVHDRCLIGASALSYTSIVSLVPLTAIALAVFSGFSSFNGARQRLLQVTLENFAPSVGDSAAAWFSVVAANAAQTTAIGVVALVVTAVLVLATIEEHLHFIFRVTTARPWGQRVIGYWTVLTLGPVLVGAALSVTGGMTFPLGQPAPVETVWTHLAAAVWAAALALVGFTLLYRLIPNRPVVWRACLAGGAVAAALLEVLKLGFGIYISRMSSYSTIYGALAGIPIALLWMYVFWSVVLLGAEVAACLAPPHATQVSVEHTASAGV